MDHVSLYTWKPFCWTLSFPLIHFTQALLNLKQTSSLIGSCPEVLPGRGLVEGDEARMHHSAPAWSAPG